MNGVDSLKRGDDLEYVQYKGLMERKHKKSVRKIMRELCVEKRMDATSGAKHLGIAREIFVSWRADYGMESKNLLFEELVETVGHLTLGTETTLQRRKVKEGRRGTVYEECIKHHQ